MRPAIVTLLSDFGIADAYVGAMKGVMLGVDRDLRLVDITHEVAPQDVFGGALVLRHAAPFFPRGTVHLAVVDPGVGSARAPIVIETALGWFVGPNNGILTLAAPAPRQAHRLENPAFRLPVLSSTFHGRDLFAPAAAHLASGVPLDRLGPAVTDLVRLLLPLARHESGLIVGEVIGTDRFGNLLTTVTEKDLASLDASRGLVVEIAGIRVGAPVSAYSDARPGAAGAIMGSAGRLEIFVREGSARLTLGLGRGAPVIVKRA